MFDPLSLYIAIKGLFYTNIDPAEEKKDKPSNIKGGIITLFVKQNIHVSK